ncbi:MAG: radical SAM protein [Gammaproteobacteria bacterium]|nr:MAG: radical SAM protein [Gammaproteobacteria bacterium]
MDRFCGNGNNGQDTSNLPGYIAPYGLKELWFHTGTTCNLSCPFCLEGSQPGDDRIQKLSLEDAKPYLDEAKRLGAEQFSFTGGEPFVNKEFISILDYALELNPCLVLTNATEPLIKKMDDVVKIMDKPNKLSFRVSIDSYIEAEHDKYRGIGNFKKALNTAKKLHSLGFHISIARQMRPDENTEGVNGKYQQLFKEHGLPEDTLIVVFPDFERPNTQVKTPTITEHCMTTYQTEETRKKFMCAFSKMIVKKDGRLTVLPCTLVDDSKQYEQGSKLEQSLAQKIFLHHHRCFSCFKYGSSCSES